jgi:tetratricopeptide (TPR) repeat protein
MKLLNLCVLSLCIASSRASAVDSDLEKECRARLKTIGAALASYERDNGKLPDYLSALVPKYLPAAASLLCPADAAKGDIGLNRHMQDPTLPCSYEYLFSVVMSNGLGSPLGNFPKPDVGNSWGTWRHVNTHQRTYFGPWVPLVRCYHHRPAPDSTDPDRILNLVPPSTVEGEIYVSGPSWESSPEAAGEVLKRFEGDLVEGGVPAARNKWYLARVLEHTYDWAEMLKRPENRKRLRNVSTIIVRSADAMTEERDFKGFLYRVAGRCYVRIGDFDQALLNAKKSLEISNPRDRKAILFLLAEIYEIKKQDSELLPIYEELHREDERNGFVLTRLANVYERKGRREEAESLRDQADPTRSLIGKQAPDFDVPLLSGGQARLKELLKGKKALLVNFWYYN